MTLWTFLTRWGNSLLLLPTAMAIGLSLWAMKEKAVAWRWLVSFGAALALVLISKVAFLGWGLGSSTFDFTGISGHATLAAAVLPMLAWWLAFDRSRRFQRRVVLGAALFAAVVGLSRILLSQHSISEVLTGLALGFGVAWLSIPRTPTAMTNLKQLRWLVLLVLLAAGSLSRAGDSDEAHGFVVNLALALSGRSEPFQRRSL